jgi:uncharacterized membrane protein
VIAQTVPKLTTKEKFRPMTTIGDVLMVFGAIALISLTLFCSMVLFTLLLPARAAKMAHQLDSATGKTIAVGAGIFIPVFGLIFILAAMPSPVTKVIALIIAMAFLGCAALGGAGLTRLAADRLRSASDNQSLGILAATTRAAALVVGALNIPLLGWMFLTPLMLFASIGSFAHGFLSRRVPTSPWEPNKS